MGLITPEDIVNEIKDIDYKDPGLNNLEVSQDRLLVGENL
ncbi:MAG: hypothetical protein CM15mP70_06010 [Pelagibacteraceae bacterium]|nr:MAG: hypothetical protein CM15mP70_06010 [Pelagibacteraceae bacterium]